MAITPQVPWVLLLLAVLAADSVLSQRPGSRKPASKPASKPTPQPQPQEGEDLTDECPEPNGYFADGYQCDKYYECIEGAITEKLCPDGMVFNDYNTQVEKCDLPFNIDCSNRGELQKPKPSLHCPRQNGYFAHEESNICDQFYFCVDGKFNMITCPDGLVYNERTGICTWPDEAKKAGCSSQGDDKESIKAQLPQQTDKNQTRQFVIARGKRYTVHEDNNEEEQPQNDDYSEEREEEKNFELKDEAEIEKITEEGYGKDYEDGLWEDPNTPPSNDSFSEAPEDYDSADYEDKRAEEDSGSAEPSGSAERSGEANYSDYEGSEEPSTYDFSGSGARLSVGSISGDRMLLDEDGFPIFDNKFDDFDLRRWSKRDTILAEGPRYMHNYDSYLTRTTTVTPVLTTSTVLETSITTNSTNTTNPTEHTNPNSTVPTIIEKEESST